MFHGLSFPRFLSAVVLAFCVLATPGEGSSRKAARCLIAALTLGLGQPRAESQEVPPLEPPPALSAEDKTPGVKIIGTDQEGFPRVTQYFVLHDQAGQPIREADKADFKLYEEGKEVEIVDFKSPVVKKTVPATVALVLDVSASMSGEKYQALIEAVANFFETIPPGSRVAVFTFGERVESLHLPSDDPAEVVPKLRAKFLEGETRMYAGVLEGISHLREERLRKENGPLQVVVMSDGASTEPPGTIEQAIDAAKAKGSEFPIHVVGFGRAQDLPEDSMRMLASETGGNYYPAADAGRLKDVFHRIADDLSNTFTVTFRSSRELPDGTRRKVRIVYSPAGKAVVLEGDGQMYVPGMVVPARGWDGLFLLLVGGLGGAAVLPKALKALSKPKPLP